MANKHSLHASRGRLGAGLVGIAALVVATVTGLVFSPASTAVQPAGITGYQIVQGTSTDISDGESASAYIYCPTGKTAVSAGVVSHSPLTYIRELQPTVDPRAWLVTVTNTASLGYTEHFQPYAVCVDTASVPGLHVVSQTASVPSPGSAATDAYCAADEYVLGGGVFGHNANSYASVLKPNDYRSWQAFVYNAATLSYADTFTVYAVCVPQSDVTSYAQQESGYGDNSNQFLTEPVTGDPTARTNTASAPYCAADQVAVGGGAFNHDQTNSYISSSYPSSDGRSWLETSTDINPPDPSAYNEFALPNDICVNGTTTSPPTLIATTTTLTANPTSATVNQPVTLTATVTPQSGTGVPTGTVSFYDNGTLIGTSTLVGGVATITATFGGGPHTITATYSGDTNYLPSSTTTPLTVVTVACTTTITGTHNAVVVASGTTCISNATITGGISVAKGATLDIENSTVNGSISASAPAALRICGSHTGGIVATAATGLVLIGNPMSNCAANTVSASILAANNKGGLVIVGNTVSGTVTATGNTGTPITVSGNHS